MSTRLLADRYELHEKIGDGGMAVVYKARCRLLNRYVAIKILKPEFARNIKFIENFRRESQAAARLSHPNIVSIYDVGREGNVHFIVMELIEGHILSDLIAEKGAMDWKRAVEITRQLASALSFAHKNHIIHRDVKPHNVLITKDGTAKLTDFGIAKAIDSSDMSDETQTVMGSVHYFSPEQARGGYVDEKSDIYSLGIVLFEMLTGKVPFDGENPVSVALMHINNPMPKPTDLVPEIPKEIEEVVMKATDKIQINRYATADEMLEALQDAELTVLMADSKRHFEAQEAEKEKEKEAETGETGVKDSEEENMKGKKKVRVNKIKLAAVIAALICALPISIFASHLFNGLGGGGEEFEAPDFRGMSFDAAKIAASEYGLKLEQGDLVYSADYDAELICSQVPDAGTNVKEGKTITVNISKGMKEGTVPNIIGKSQSDAEFALEKYGFHKGTVTKQKSNLPSGIVISQTPGAGEEATPGSYVAFTVSEGIAEDEAVVPKLLGMTFDEAKAALEEAGLGVGNVTYEKSGAYPKDQVMWQSQEAKKSVESGTAIDIKISSGTEEPAPVSSSIYVDYSAAENEVFWLTVTVSDESGTHNIITRAQRIKSDGGENVYLEGQGAGTVTVIFDNTVVGEYSVNFGGGAAD